MKSFKNFPYTFRTGLTAQNRLVIPPMASQTADAHGYVTGKTLRHYSELAKARPGLFYAEYSFVHPSGKGERLQLGVSDDSHIDGLRALSSVIKSSGAISSLQLVHVGGKAQTEITGSTLLSPSGIRVPVKGWQPDESRTMTVEEIGHWKRWFLEAATRAHRAGFEMIELHAAHGYGLNQFLSTITNRRQDEWGLLLEDRARLLLEIVTALRQTLPELLISVRLPGQDHFPEGLTLTETQMLVSWLERAGADLINVSSGIGGWRRPDHRQGEGYLVADAAALKSATRLPVIGVGGIQTAAYIDEAVSRGLIDFAAVGRSVLEHPLVWAAKISEGDLPQDAVVPGAGHR